MPLFSFQSGTTERKEKSTPFGVNLMRSLVIYQAAEWYNTLLTVGIPPDSQPSATTALTGTGTICMTSKYLDQEDWKQCGLWRSFQQLVLQHHQLCCPIQMH